MAVARWRSTPCRLIFFISTEISSWLSLACGRPYVHWFFNSTEYFILAVARCRSTPCRLIFFISTEILSWLSFAVGRLLSIARWLSFAGCRSPSELNGFDHQKLNEFRSDPIVSRNTNWSKLSKKVETGEWLKKIRVQISNCKKNGVFHRFLFLFISLFSI